MWTSRGYISSAELRPSRHHSLAQISLLQTTILFLLGRLKPRSSVPLMPECFCRNGTSCTF
ncbi:hypothetical protein Plhal304r1_c044g0125021 [Plasmopara halstedii]